MMLKLFLVLTLISVFEALPVQDDALLFSPESRQAMEQMAQELELSTGIRFFVLVEETFHLENFDSSSRSAFARFIEPVANTRGAMIFLQLEKGSRRGRVSFSLGLGLQGAMEREAVREILKDMIQALSRDQNYQKKLVEGVSRFIKNLKDYAQKSPAVSPDPEKQSTLEVEPAVSSSKFFWIASVLLISFIISLALFVWSRRKCPRCGSRLHVNIRPLSHGESRYKRIKIIKCFDCNYFRKYLF
ncbi:MAG: TPM domain-containing protein [Candidatus Cloacimonetes bacterium]|nr:TPM domain-containing protein [Candidatus Cloacimonadota bacterium]